MCKIYMSNKDKAEWYSQRWQKKCRSYNTIRVFTKEITILDWINVEEIEMYGIQKENFPEYNEEIYISEDYKFNEDWKKTVKQIEVITKEIFNIVWESQKSESSAELYDLRWTLAENDIQDEIL